MSEGPLSEANFVDYWLKEKSKTPIFLFYISSKHRGPENRRKFIFSPEVGKTIGGADAKEQVTPDEIGEIERFGRRTLKIEKFKLIPKENGCPDIEFLDFTVYIEGGY